TLGMDENVVGTMATVPLPARFGSTRDDAQRLRDALLFEDRIEVQLHAARGGLWVRISSQVYNDMGDMERLAGAGADPAEKPQVPVASASVRFRKSRISRRPSGVSWWATS